MSDKNSEYHTDHMHLSEEGTKELSSHLQTHLVQDEDVMREDSDVLPLLILEDVELSPEQVKKLHDHTYAVAALINQEEVTQLRREVAMLVSVLERTSLEFRTGAHTTETSDMRTEAIINTQATAQAYEAEVKAKALEEARDKFNGNVAFNFMYQEHVASGAYSDASGELDVMAGELRATSKKG